MSYPTLWPQPGIMHFRLLEDRLGALDLDCDHGYVVQSYDLGFPTVREVIYNNSLDDGTFDVTRYHGPRTVTLDLALKPHSGPTPNSPPLPAESVLRDALLAYTHPSRRPTLLFSEHQDSRVKRVMLRGTSATAAVTRANYNKVSLTWVAPRGVFRSYDERCYHFTFSSNTSDTQTYEIVNEGSSPSPWRCVLLGEAVKPRFLLNGVPLLELNYTSSAGDTIVIDSFSRTVTIDGVQTGFTYVGDSATWFPIPSGTSTLTIEQDSYTTEGYPYAYWQSMPGTPTNWAIPPGTTPVNHPPPIGAPPWAWTTDVDPATGLPGQLSIDFCYFDSYI
jgi:hypothetical protein